ncbi:MAG: hypothetical protein J2P36_13905 [Ktedonobacteraceae bacterium]|nr:hypothetical protein [Ktedonobacteraceae bacterium]
MNRHLFCSRMALLSMLVLALLVVTVSQTQTAHASDDPPGDVWSINANGYESVLAFETISNAPQLDNGLMMNSPYWGHVFNDRLMGWWIISDDLPYRAVGVSFVRLGEQASGYLTYFQVYTGVVSTDGLHVAGTFRSFTGARGSDPATGKMYYSYTASRLYPWTATFRSTNFLEVAEPPTGYGRWQLSANGWPGELLTREDTQLFAYGNGAIGYLPSSPTATSSGEYPVYFLRALSADLSSFQVYQGTYKTRIYGIGPGTRPTYRTTASGLFTEVIGGASGFSYDWNATYLGRG